MMKRREFITLLGGAAAAWPLAARAQQPAMPGDRVLLHPTSLEALAGTIPHGIPRGLKETGYVSKARTLRLNIAGLMVRLRSIAGACGRSGAPSGHGDHSRRQRPRRRSQRRRPRPFPLSSPAARTQSEAVSSPALAGRMEI